MTPRLGFPLRFTRPGDPKRAPLRPRRRVALLGLVAALSMADAATCRASGMAFAVTQLGSDAGGLCGRNCEQVISAKGGIGSDTPERFRNFLENHQQEQNLRPVVLIDSQGGDVIGAMQLGAMFRQIGAEVIVGEAMRVSGTDRMTLAPGLCISACVYAFLGGRSRVVPSTSRLGIHRMIRNDGLRDQVGSEGMVADLSSYTKSMGVDPDVILQAERIAPDAIRYLTQSEIARWRLARSHR